MKFRLIILFCLLLVAFRLVAEEKKTIQVKFTITENQYRICYGSETGQIEKACSSLMVDFMNKTFGFFHFTTEQNDHVLKIELVDNEQDLSTHSSLKEVGFKAFIKPEENRGAEEPVYWVFRPIERYNESLPDLKEEFIGDIIRIFTNGVLKNKAELVNNILSKVEVADDFYFVQDQKRFILPLANKENNIANASVFLIMALVPDELIGLKASDIKTRVIGPISNREAVIQKYHLSPATYPERSLVVEQEQVNSGEIPVDFSNLNTKGKKIFILKHFAYTDSDIQLISPETTANK